MSVQEAMLFKLSSLQQQLSGSVPAELLEKANHEYNELVLKYQESLQKQTSATATSHALEHLQVCHSQEIMYICVLMSWLQTQAILKPFDDLKTG